MGIFAGIVRLDGGPIDRSIQDRLSRAVAGPRAARTETCVCESAVFVKRTPEPANWRKGDLQLIVGEGGRAVSAAFVRLDNRAELATALRISPSELAHCSDANLLVRMLQRWDGAGVARCLGAFAFARWDADARRLILGRDCLGQRPLLFHRAGPIVIFSNDLGCLLAMPDVPREIDDLALANFLVRNHNEPRRTLYRGIERTPSAAMVTIDDGGVRHRHYWWPDFDTPPPYRRDEDYVERARELFDQAVLTATADSRDVAIATSGGLDSSAIAATVARLGRAERITCYTLVPPADFGVDLGANRYHDERDKVQALARMYPALDLRLLAPEALHPIDEDDTRHFARTHLPSKGPSILGYLLFVRDAINAGGHPLALVGAAGNLGLSWTGPFSLVSLLKSGRWGRFAHELIAVARNEKRSLARTFISDVVWPGAPNGLRRLMHRTRGRDPEDASRFAAVNPSFIAEFDLAARWRAQGYSPWLQVSGWHSARHRARFLFGHQPADYDSRTYLDRADEPEFRDPHADRRLLEFALSVPEPLYRRNGIPRSFARAVFADRLPREILDERRRGRIGVWFRRLDMKRQAIAEDIERLEGSATARRLIDLPRLQRLLKEWPKDEHAAQRRENDYKALTRAVHVGRFIRWVEGGNA